MFYCNHNLVSSVCEKVKLIIKSKWKHGYANNLL